MQPSSRFMPLGGEAMALIALVLTCLPASNAVSVEPIQVSIVMHNEEPNPPFHPDFIKNPPIFWQHRTALVAFANMLDNNGVMFNWQSDWNFLRAVALYDTGTPSTNGKNVVRWLKEDMAFEVDPHAHETLYNYADVASLINDLGVVPSNTVGGMIVFPPENSILEQFWEPIEGWQYPDYVWEAEILWGGGTYLHQSEDHLWAAGIWKPKDKNYFLIHDEKAPLAVVGKYRPGWLGLNGLINLQQGGELVDGTMYTCTITCSQVKLAGDPQFVQDFENAIQSFDALGDLRWVGLAEAIGIWETDYRSQPNILRWLAFGDADADGNVDGDDFAEMLACVTGPDPYGGIGDPDCYVFDFEPDDDVDFTDFGEFMLAFTGP